MTQYNYVQNQLLSLEDMLKLFVVFIRNKNHASIVLEKDAGRVIFMEFLNLKALRVRSQNFFLKKLVELLPNSLGLVARINLV